jgi:hypothetical protein
MTVNKSLSKVIAVVVALAVLMAFTTPWESFAAKGKSKDNYAKSIKVSGGKLDKKFKKKTTSYKISLTAKQTKSTITFKKAHKKATVSVKIGAKKWTKYSKKASIKKTIKVANGKTVTVKYRVKAQSGKLKTYTIKVTRAKAAAPKPPTPAAKQNQAALAIKSGSATVTTLSKQYGDASFALTASGGSGTGAYSWTSSNPAVATVSGGAVAIGTPGITAIILSKAEDGNYNSATPTAIILIVSAREVTISYVKGGADTKVYDGTANALTALKGTFEINNLKAGDTSGVITVSEGTATFADADAGDDKAVTFAGFSLTGTKANLYRLTAQPAQTTANITKLTLGEISVVVNSWTYGDENPDIEVEGVSGNIPVQFTYYSDTQGQNSIEKPTDAGTYYIKATIEGTDNYTSAVSEITEFTIDPADQEALAIKDGGDTVTTLTIPYGNFNLTADGGSGTGAVSWESSNAAVATINETSGAITMAGLGTTTITLNKAADSNHNAATEATLALTVTYSGFTLDWDAYNNNYSYPTKTVNFADIDASAAGTNYDHGSTSEATTSRIFRARLFKGGTTVDNTATVNWSIVNQTGSSAEWNTDTTTGAGTNYLNIPEDYAGTISVKVSSDANPGYDVTFDIEVDVRPEVATTQRSLTGSTVGDSSSDWLEIATKTVGGNDYSLIVRKTALADTTAFGVADNNDYMQSALRGKINTWYARLDSESALRTNAVTHNAMSRLGTSMINTQDGYSLPLGGTPEETTDIAFLLSSNEAISFLSKGYRTQDDTTVIENVSNTPPLVNWTALADETSGTAWLRSPGITAANASYLSTTGNVSNTTTTKIYCVRPALWVSSDIFDIAD